MNNNDFFDLIKKLTGNNRQDKNILYLIDLISSYFKGKGAIFFLFNQEIKLFSAQFRRGEEIINRFLIHGEKIHFLLQKEFTVPEFNNYNPLSIQYFNYNKCNEPSIKEYIRIMQISSFVCISIFNGEKFLGFLHVYDPEENFNKSIEPDSGLLIPFLALTLENFILHSRAMQFKSRASTIVDITQEGEILRNPGEVLNSLLSIVSSVLEYDIGIFYQGTTANNLKIKDFIEMIPAKESEFKKDIQKNVIPYVFKNQKTLLTHSDFYKSIIAIPLIHKNQISGVIILGKKEPYSFTETDSLSLKLIISQILSIDSMFNALIKLRSYTENIVESMTTGLVTFDIHGNIHMFNSYANQLFPFLSSINEDSPPILYNKLFSPHPEVLNLIHRTIHLGEILENQEISISKTDKTITLESSSFPFRDENGIIIGFALLLRDISEIKKLKESLYHSRRLAELGRFATGVAHEIRNPLTGIRMIIQFLKGRMKEESVCEQLGVVLSEVDRLENIIQDILVYARPASPKIHAVSISDILEHCLTLLKSQAEEKKLEIEKNIVPKSLIIQADPDQFKQVFLNILKNAIEAVPFKGKVSVNAYCEGAFDRIQVTDYGPGISEEDQQKILTPFYTTKDDGTGLGLPIAFRIITEHGGKLYIDSIINKFTKISILLPTKTANIEI